MMIEPRPGLHRRDMLAGMALLALVTGLPLATVACTSPAAGDDETTDRQRQLFRAVSQIVIPKTDSLGAGDVGVGDFVLLALAHGLERSRQPLPKDADPELQPRRADGSLRHAAWLESALDRAASGDFLELTPARQTALLTAIDADAYAKGQDAHPWRTIKALILTGYYTSEEGGARELRYEPVPGRFDPDFPLKPGDRAISNDWTAVEFG